MALEVLLWLVVFFVVVGLLGIVVYQLMSLSDLEFDFINPYDSSSRVNMVVIPEFAIQGGLCLLFLFSGHWFMFLLSAPLMYYHVQLYMSGRHLLDVTEIFNLLNGEKKYRMIKLGYYLGLFFIVLYRMLWAVIEDDN